MQLRAARRGLLDEDRVARQALGERGEHVAGAQRLAVGGRRRRVRAAQLRRHPVRPPVDGHRQRGADRGRVAEHGELHRAAVRLVGILRDDGQPRALAHQRAGVERVLAQRAGADDEHDVVRRERVAQPACGGRAGARRTADGPAGTRPGRRTAPGTPGRPGARPASAAPPSRRRRRRRRRPRSPARRPARRGRRARRPSRRPAPAERSRRAGPSVSCGSGAGASQSSIGTTTIAGPRPVTASW